jgi:outer membrane biosynthesis protein TonB
VLVTSVAGLAMVNAPAPVSAAMTQPAAAPASTPSATAAVSVVAVLADNTALRSGDGIQWYEVARLKSGTLLRVDGQRDQWLRVAYPAGSRALVSADEAAPRDGGVVVLTRPSKLIAANASGDVRASWAPLLETDLTPGTTLRLIEPVRGTDARVTHYAVTPPDTARAWIPGSAVRQATPEEVATLTGGSVPTPPAAPPASPPASPPSAVPAPGTPAPVLVPPTGTPETPPPQPPAATPGPETAPAPIPALPPEVTRADELLRLYERVRALPPEQTEAEATAAEREIRAFTATLGDSPLHDSLRRRVEARAQVLALMADAARLRREHAESQRRLERSRGELAASLEELASQRAYMIIGRLVPSVVYDGQGGRPRLFRIQAPEPGAVRTLGYLVPRPGGDATPGGAADLTGKLGMVVGIDGQVRFDEALRANLVTPTRVDVLRLTAVTPTSPTPPTTPTSAPVPASPSTEPAPPAPPEMVPPPASEPQPQPAPEPEKP